MEYRNSRKHDQSMPVRWREGSVSIKGVALGVWLLLVCQGCASLSPVSEEDLTVNGSSESSQRAVFRSDPILIPEWEEFTSAGPIELLFHDADRHVSVRVTGPYRVVFWDYDRVELIGQVDSGFGGDASLTVWHRGDQTWAYMRMAQTEYLTRLE